tara:strand:+ start:72 stop:371 length:300 start_codon:yes stop_codon:yes gene_type:complete
MAHFCKIDDNNKVVEVIVIDNNELLDENNQEQEMLGVNFIKNSLGLEGTWIQTSFNGNFRSNFAGIEDTYDAENDVFIKFKPVGDNYVLNTSSWCWEKT